MLQEIGYVVEVLHAAAVGFVILCWFVLCFAYLIHQPPPRPPERKRARGWEGGIILQALGYAAVWMEPRWRMRSPLALEFAGDLAAILLTGGSVWLAFTAVPRLGKQYGIAARVVEGHQLVTSGPYRMMRHPIYAAMYGMLLATGLALGRWSNLAVAILLFAPGTAIRIFQEERLLRETFGAEFEAYAKSVPAVLPRWF